MATAATIISIIVSILSAGYMGWQGAVQGVQGSLKTHISNIMNDFRKAISSKRLNFNKILSLLQSNQQKALMNYMYQNPIIAKRFDEILGNQDVVAEITAKQQAIENDIADILSQLSSMGYNSSITGTSKEGSRANQLKTELDKKKSEYDDLGSQLQSVDTSASSARGTYTADIDARSQNLNGGMK